MNDVMFIKENGGVGVCAICGLLSKYEEPVDLSVVEKMMEVQRHRGPDDSGKVLLSVFGSDRKNLGLGFNRLRILISI